MQLMYAGCAPQARKKIIAISARLHKLASRALFEQQQQQTGPSPQHMPQQQQIVPEPARRRWLGGGGKQRVACTTVRKRVASRHLHQVRTICCCCCCCCTRDRWHNLLPSWSVDETDRLALRKKSRDRRAAAAPPPPTFCVWRGVRVVDGFGHLWLMRTWRCPDVDLTISVRPRSAIQCRPAQLGLSCVQQVRFCTGSLSQQCE